MVRVEYVLSIFPRLYNFYIYIYYIIGKGIGVVPMPLLPLSYFGSIYTAIVEHSQILYKKYINQLNTMYNRQLNQLFNFLKNEVKKAMNFGKMVNGSSHSALSNYQATLQRPSFSKAIAHQVQALKFGQNKSRTLCGWVQ